MREKYQELIDALDATMLDVLRSVLADAESDSEKERVMRAIDSALDKRLELMTKRDLV